MNIPLFLFTIFFTCVLTFLFTLKIIKPKMRDCKFGHDWTEWNNSHHVTVAFGYALTEQSRRCFRCGEFKSRFYNETFNITMEQAEQEYNTYMKNSPLGKLLKEIKEKNNKGNI